MGPFAHLGLTAGAAVIVNSIWNYRRASGQDRPIPGAPGPTKNAFWKPLGFTSAIAVLFGSLVSDAIDKPVGHLIFADYFSNGRIFSHTLAFAGLVSLAGAAVWIFTHRTWLSWVGFGVWMHLILDQMWLEPRTLFWPLLGADFPRYIHQEFTSWLLGIFRAIINDPRILLSELSGFIILLWFAGVILIAYIKKRRLL